MTWYWCCSLYYGPYKAQKIPAYNVQHKYVGRLVGWLVTSNRAWYYNCMHAVGIACYCWFVEHVSFYYFYFVFLVSCVFTFLFCGRCCYCFLCCRLFHNNKVKEKTIFTTICTIAPPPAATTPTIDEQFCFFYFFCCWRCWKHLLNLQYFSLWGFVFVFHKHT